MKEITLRLTDAAFDNLETQAFIAKNDSSAESRVRALVHCLEEVTVPIINNINNKVGRLTLYTDNDSEVEIKIKSKEDKS